MPQLVSVRFRFSPKPLWFDPQGKEYPAGTDVLVETERGREVGVIYEPVINATDKQINKLKSPLKPVVRALTDLDYEHLEVLEEKGQAAMPYFREKIEEYELDIKPVEVQYIFSGERAIFFFSSEERVDFRDLVRELAQHFHVRVDMRQIGARDEAKEMGGLAHCGEEFCCTRFGGEFQPVSIRMAKEQDLPLNPSKISGACGRLMCCLRYEFEAYKDFKKRAPKKGTAVDTPLGEAVISGYNTPSEMMELKLQDGKKLNVPLGEIACSTGKDGCTRCSVGHDTIERCAARSMLFALGTLDQQLHDSLGQDKEAMDVDLAIETKGPARRRRRTARSGSGDTSNASATATKGARDSRAGGTGATSEQEKPSGGGRTRRRRSSGGANASAQAPSPSRAVGNTQKVSQKGAQNGQNQPASGNKKTRAENTENRTEKPRPGQRSSGLRKRRSHSAGESQGGNNGSNATANTQRGRSDQAAAASTAETPQRTARRRRRQRPAGSGASGSNDTAQG